jgi:hypothetical protein
VGTPDANPPVTTASVPTNPDTLRNQLTNPTTGTATATAISQALASAGNNCGSPIAQALSRESCSATAAAIAVNMYVCLLLFAAAACFGADGTSMFVVATQQLQLV